MNRPVSVTRRRGPYIALALATIAIGLLIHFYGAPLGSAGRDVMGDALWAGMMVWWVSALRPRSPIMARAGTALVICWTVEASQLLHTPALDAFRGTTLGQLTIGSGFDPRDLAAYAGGVVVAAIVDAIWVSRV